MVENITEITTHYMKKHVESCWLSIDCSLVRILEQMENLREYFLKEIPKQKGFNQKNGLANNDCYKRISSVLKQGIIQKNYGRISFLQNKNQTFEGS